MFAWAGMKVYETNEKELVMEPAIRWAGNPNIVLCSTFRLGYPVKIRVQVRMLLKDNLSDC